MGRRSLTLLAVALLLGSAAAFTWTEKLKLERSPIGAPRFDRRFSPVCGCHRATARVSFLLRRSDRLDVVVVDEDEEVVTTLAEGLDRRPGRIELEWNGRDGEGRVVADGAYRVQVRLDRARRTILMPAEVHVDTKSPVVRLLGVSAMSFSLSGDGIEFRYTVNEPGRPILLVRNKAALRGRARKAGRASLTWKGERRSRTIKPGLYRVALAVVDRAGNRSAPTEAVTVVVVA